MVTVPRSARGLLSLAPPAHGGGSLGALQASRWDTLYTLSSCRAGSPVPVRVHGLGGESFCFSPAGFLAFLGQFLGTGVVPVVSGPVGSQSVSDINVPMTTVGAQCPSGRGAHLLPFQTRPVRGQSHPPWKQNRSAPPGPPTPACRGKFPAAQSSRRLPVWWPRASTGRPVAPSMPSSAPRHCPAMLCNETLPAPSPLPSQAAPLSSPLPPALPRTSLSLPRASHPAWEDDTEGRDRGWTEPTCRCPPALPSPLPHLPSPSRPHPCLLPTDPAMSPPLHGTLEACAPEVGAGRPIRRRVEATGRLWGSVGRS